MCQASEGHSVDFPTGLAGPKGPKDATEDGLDPLELQDKFANLHGCELHGGSKFHYLLGSDDATALGKAILGRAEMAGIHVADSSAEAWVFSCIVSEYGLEGSPVRDRTGSRRATAEGRAKSPGGDHATSSQTGAGDQSE